MIFVNEKAKEPVATTEIPTVEIVTTEKPSVEETSTEEVSTEVVTTEAVTTEIVTTETPTTEETTDEEGNNDVLGAKEPANFEFENDHIINKGESFDPMDGVIVTHPVHGEVTQDVIVSGTVDTSKPGEYKLEYTYTDKDGNVTTVNRVIKVTETTPVDPPSEKPDKTNEEPSTKKDERPTLKINTGHNYVLGARFEPMDGIQAIDPEDGDITDKVTIISNDVNVNKAGRYSVVYEVIDSVGNKLSITRTIVIKEATEPVKSAEPVESTEPVKSTELVKSAEPVEPTEPVKSAEPVEPTDPVNSVESEKTIEYVKLTEQVKEEKTKAHEGSNKVVERSSVQFKDDKVSKKEVQSEKLPSTGQSDSPIIPIAGLITLIAGIAITTIRREKN